MLLMSVALRSQNSLKKCAVIDLINLFDGWEKKLLGHTKFFCLHNSILDTELRYPCNFLTWVTYAQQFHLNSRTLPFCCRVCLHLLVWPQQEGCFLELPPMSSVLRGSLGNAKPRGRRGLCYRAEAVPRLQGGSQPLCEWRVCWQKASGCTSSFSRLTDCGCCS